MAFQPEPTDFSPMLVMEWVTSPPGTASWCDCIPFKTVYKDSVINEAVTSWIIAINIAPESCWPRGLFASQSSEVFLTLLSRCL